MQPVTSSVISFPVLEIKLYQRRVLRDGEDIPLTRLEYGTLAYLASSPGRVFTQEQIFEAVWDMNSDSCHSSVVNVIYNVRKKIEADSRNPVYIKTLLGVGYKFDMQGSGGIKHRKWHKDIGKVKNAAKFSLIKKRNLED